MSKNQILKDVRVEKLGYGWVGIARLENGKTVMIKGALPGSVVDCKIIKSKKDYVEAHIVAVKHVDAGVADGEVKCPHYQFPYQTQSGVERLPEHKDGCWGCKWQIVSYDQQLQLKYQIVQDCFHKAVKHIWAVTIFPVVPSPLVFGYRNKIEYSFWKYFRRGEALEWRDIAEHWQLGFHKQGSFEKVIDIDQCYLVSQEMHEVYAYVKAQLLASGLPVHDSKTHKWLLRHMVIRHGVHTGQILLNLSISTHHLVDHPQDEERWTALISAWKQDAWLQERMTSLVINENNGLADVVKPEQVHMDHIRWPGSIYEELHFDLGATISKESYEDGHAREELPEDEDKIMRFRVSPFSFFQTNTLGAEQLFSKAAQVVGRVEGNIIDLYCGSGTIGLCFLALGKWKHLKGIEIVEDAVKDAHFNAKINGFEEHASFYAGKAEDLLRQWVIDDTFFVWGDLVVVDPPREGLHARVVDFLVTLNKRYPFKLLYISCNPVTMARDIQLLVEWGFRCGDLHPVDMFPHTHHIEVVGVLYG